MRGDRVVHGQKQRAKLRGAKIELRRKVEPTVLAGLLLDEDGYVLVEQIQNEDHSADEEAVQRVVQKARHGVEMVDGVYRQRVKDEVNQRRNEQHGESPVQR